MAASIMVAVRIWGCKLVSEIYIEKFLAILNRHGLDLTPLLGIPLRSQLISEIDDLFDLIYLQGLVDGEDKERSNSDR